MIQINIGDHASTVTAGVDSSGIPRGAFEKIPSDYISIFQWARTQAIWISRNKPGANPYFAALPGGRTLSQILADGSMWVNYMEAPGIYGFTPNIPGNEIGISDAAIAKGQWMVLATMIHELAHANGAPTTNAAAENALVPCGLGYLSEQTSGVDDPSTPYDPRTTG